MAILEKFISSKLSHPTIHYHDIVIVLYRDHVTVLILGGHNVTELDPVWFRNHIGVVSQEPVLFACSISDNISFGRGDATHEEIVEAAKQANAHDFISSFDVSVQFCKLPQLTFYSNEKFSCHII